MSTKAQEDIWQKELLTVKEVASYLRLSRATVWRWCQQGAIPAIRVGRNWRIRQADLLNLIDHLKVEQELSLLQLRSFCEDNQDELVN
jgi:excisionase family DNA binding protein